MSYEGSVYYLCKSGHKLVYDYYDDPDPTNCPECGERIAYHCSVDHTNGYEEDNPYSHTPEFEVIEEWEETVVIVKRLYGPKGDRWRSQE